MRLSLTHFMKLSKPNRLSFALGLSLALTFAPEAAQAAAENQKIEAPYYGDVLYEFFQDHYFTSVTNFMVSQHFSRIAPHTEEAEVLRGGILLSYGLHREAGDIFTRLIELGASPATRDRAWFYLAKIRYQRGYLSEAEDAIAHIGNFLPREFQEERGLLRANLLMAGADYSGAVSVLQTMDTKAQGARYVRYNLGIALMKAGKQIEGRKLLDELGLATAENEEYRSLRDRANLALGYSALADQQAKLAQTYLERVRLKSPSANKALLGLGWAAAAIKQPKLALIPWQELAQREDSADTAVLEAHIAIPYAYAELGAYGQAVAAYNTAINNYTRENNNLTTSIAAINSGKLLSSLIDSNPGQEMGWFWQLQSLTEMPSATHLAHILAQHEFQEAFKNYRDLRFLTKNLEEWRDKLKVFEEMLENRRLAFADHLPQVTQQAHEILIEPMRARHTALAQILETAETSADGLAFADTKQLDLLDRVESVKTTLKNYAENTELTAIRDTASERVRLAAGILRWQLAQDYADRLWQSKKELQEIATGLDHAQRLNADLNQVTRDEPARFDEFDARIKAIMPALQIMLTRVLALTEQQQHAVQHIAVTELRRQQERLMEYSTQAKFAVAQLYDRTSENSKDKIPAKKEADSASKY